jgi:hypothetical protein
MKLDTKSIADRRLYAQNQKGDNDKRWKTQIEMKIIGEEHVPKMTIKDGECRTKS